jgi:hypothetical protein
MRLWQIRMQGHSIRPVLLDVSVAMYRRAHGTVIVLFLDRDFDF